MVRPTNLQDTEFTGLRGRVATLVEHHKFTNFIAGLIILNAITLGLETDPTVKLFYGRFLSIFDYFVIAAFTVEISLKLFAYRLSFFRAGWNVFDFLIVVISLVPSGGPLTVLRVLRVFRILRLMSIVPSMRRVLKALFDAVPGMASILGIMLIIFYIAAVVATKIFGTHPDPVMQGLYGDLGHSMYTLFQVMTLEDWPDVAAPTIAHFPWAWIYFILFIIVTSFAVLNLFVGIIVDAMDIVHDFEEEDKAVKDTIIRETEGLHKDMQAIQQQMTELRTLIVEQKKK
ncbi:MAG: ion transporter [Rhodospirillales bacterium]|nr:ion transporter [Rhodospirillales bacterium]MCB9997315.1 ion transporter [Rhodospirillales bacterium]